MDIDEITVDDMDDPLVVVYSGRARAACFERALVLRALDIDHVVVATTAGFALAVHAADAGAAREQIDLYVAENAGWPPRIAALKPRTNGLQAAILYALTLVLFAWLQTNNALGLDWYDAGKTNAGLVRDGEWWRTITALTLHLDVGHLAGNLVIGAFFGLLASELMGSGLAWLSIVIAGALGNALNAMVQPDYHTSVGASTGVFAALGLASTYGWVVRAGHRAAFRWAPVVAGAVLLTFFGVGGERTDVVAHLTGFVAGAGMGLLYGYGGDRFEIGSEGQARLGVAAFALLVIGWFYALSDAANAL
ncbi:MAG: rhomboid family intramembrane serine protease [Pseudomonadota bacterium]